MSAQPAVVVGAGGHARSLIEAMRTGGQLDPVACTDPRAELHGSDLDGVPIVGGDDRLPGLLEEGIAAAVIGLGATGDNGPRRRLFDQVARLDFTFPVVVAGSAVVSSSAQLHAGAVVLAGAVLGPGVTLESNAIVNTGAIIEHECTVGAHAHVASGAVLGGAVEVGPEAHVGLGASVRQGLRLGARALVGAGAVVVADVPDDTVVTGCPAKPRN